MRDRFYRLAADALEDDPRVAMVFAEIGVAEMPQHPRLFDAAGLRAAVRGADVVLVEPYLAGTSAAEASAAAEHRAAHGLDAEGIRASVVNFAA